MRAQYCLLAVLLMAVMVMPAAAGDLPHREAAVAGLWYEASADGLRTQVQSLLDRAARNAVRKPDEPPVALVVPHAGYVYSGSTAAAGYVHLRGGKWERVVLLAPAHYGAFRGASITPAAAYDTPLGPVYLDLETCRRLQTHALFVDAPDAHVREHALECQLPFLQVTLPKVRIIPILVGDLKSEDVRTLAGLLEPLLDEQTLLVVSSDFTHYGPNYGFVPFRDDPAGNLKKWNLKAAGQIAALDYDGFMEHIRTTRDTICGRNGISIAIRALQQLAKKKVIKGRVLEYTTSGEITRDFTKSVSYVSILFADPQVAGGAQETPAASEYTLSPAEKNTLLSIARRTLDAYMRDGRQPAVDVGAYTLTPRLKELRGAFVTLTRGGELRGCIGYVTPQVPLYQAVADMAVNAAVRDPRFPPVTRDELRKLRIEISVLSPLAPCPDPQTVQVGKHGLVIQKSGRSGLLLPQVPVEWGWDRRQFLEQVCRKAGLPAGAYREPDAVLMTFTAVVFNEKE
ncbi:MAG: AmmeMemoRadiSam system protein B [Acidobacteria bacterium]|nr:AmmeMemoRadiSam system protein B [Acidobacteriota bacterium]